MSFDSSIVRRSPSCATRTTRVSHFSPNVRSRSHDNLHGPLRISLDLPGEVTAESSSTIILLRLGMAVKSNVVEAFDGRKPGGADPSFDGAALMDPDTLFAD